MSVLLSLSFNFFLGAGPRHRQILSSLAIFTFSIPETFYYEAKKDDITVYIRLSIDVSCHERNQFILNFISHDCSFFSPWQ
jgi:hypothetical protein